MCQEERPGPRRVEPSIPRPALGSDGDAYLWLGSPQCADFVESDTSDTDADSGCPHAGACLVHTSESAASARAAYSIESCSSQDVDGSVEAQGAPLRRQVRIVGKESPMVAKSLASGSLDGDLAHVLWENDAAASGRTALVFEVVSTPEDLLQRSGLWTSQRNSFGSYGTCGSERPGLAEPAADVPAFTLFVLAICEPPGEEEGGPDKRARVDSMVQYTRVPEEAQRASLGPEARSPSRAQSEPRRTRQSSLVRRLSSRGSFSGDRGRSHSLEGSEQSALRDWQRALASHRCRDAWASDLSEQMRFLQSADALLGHGERRLTGLLVITGKEHWPFFHQGWRQLRGCLVVQQLGEFLGELKHTEHLWMAPSMDMLQRVPTDILEAVCWEPSYHSEPQVRSWLARRASDVIGMRASQVMTRIVSWPARRQSDPMAEPAADRRSSLGSLASVRSSSGSGRKSSNGSMPWMWPSG